MSLSPESLLFAAIIISLLALYVLLRRRALVKDTAVQAVPRPGFSELKEQVGLAIESGRRLHISLGRAGLERAHAPTSVAAQHAADVLVEASVRSGSPPDLSVGDATLLTPAQDNLQSNYDARRRLDYEPEQVAFVAPHTAPIAYATGTAALIEPNDIGSTIVVGRVGRELAYLADNNAQQNIMQVLGTDDPEGMAVALTYTPTPLLGEELLAAEATLKENAEAVAGIQLQNLLRLLVVLVLLVTAVLAFLGLDFNTLVRSLG
ncbi:MAG: hypothetical protein KDD89_03655 [Anaerolineales bacterium]|nr:hypothetical protein [Anaerolineales bacterium]